MPDIREFNELWPKYATAHFNFPAATRVGQTYLDSILAGWEVRWHEGRGEEIWVRDLPLRRDGLCDPGADPAEEWNKSKQTILAEAESIINGSRQNDYGTGEKNLTRIAAMWSAYLGEHITPRQVAMMMVLLKVSRDAHKPKRDNLVDLAGYAALADDVGS